MNNDIIKMYEIFRKNCLNFFNNICNLDILEEKYYNNSSTQTLITKQPTKSIDGFEVILIN
jgi:hypothetical protein